MSEPGQKQSGFGRGILVGCLIPLAVIGVIILAVLGYAGYYVFFGYKGDAAFQTAIARVQRDPVARAVLGSDIVLSGFPSYGFTVDQTGHHARYDFAVHGSKAEGKVHAELEIFGQRNDIRVLLLVGPDGHRYDLVKGDTTAVMRLPSHLQIIRGHP